MTGLTGVCLCDVLSEWWSVYLTLRHFWWCVTLVLWLAVWGYLHQFHIHAYFVETDSLQVVCGFVIQISLGGTLMG